MTYQVRARFSWGQILNRIQIFESTFESAWLNLEQILYFWVHFAKYVHLKINFREFAREFLPKKINNRSEKILARPITNRNDDQSR